MSNERQMRMRYTDLDITYCSLGEAKRAIDEAIAEYGESATLEIETYTEYGSESVRCRVCYRSPETDEELATRLQNEEYWRNHRRQQYEQLRKEFEGK